MSGIILRVRDGAESSKAIFADSSPRCKECRSLEIDNQFHKVNLGSGT